MEVKKVIIGGVAFFIIGAITVSEANLISFYKIHHNKKAAPIEEMCRYYTDCKLPPHVEIGATGPTGTMEIDNISSVSATATPTPPYNI